VNAVVPGVLSLLPRGFVDEKRIGVQGHSWGGYQIAYMITKTTSSPRPRPVRRSSTWSARTAASAGSPAWPPVPVREDAEPLGGTLWEAPMRYIENSPIFWADKVNTPLLMMHNDEDGAVPWYQGIEYFVALRRLGKPVWMLNYNGEAHGLEGKDWTVRMQVLRPRTGHACRMQQFFDHYLLARGAPTRRRPSGCNPPARRAGHRFQRADLGLDLNGTANGPPRASSSSVG
jgi:dienelactone hydrolase